MRSDHFLKFGTNAVKKENKLPSFSQTYIHPCVINQQPYIIYPRGLAEKSPALFNKLTQHYQHQGYQLKEENGHQYFCSPQACYLKVVRLLM